MYWYEMCVERSFFILPFSFFFVCFICFSFFRLTYFFYRYLNTTSRVIFILGKRWELACKPVDRSKHSLTWKCIWIFRASCSLPSKLCLVMCILSKNLESFFPLLLFFTFFVAFTRVLCQVNCCVQRLRADYVLPDHIVANKTRPRWHKAHKKEKRVFPL